MLAVLGEHAGRNNAQFTKEKGNNGQLKHHPHNEGERGKGGDVGVQRDGAVYFIRYAISAKESERDGKQNKVTHQHTGNEQDIDGEHHLHRILPLIFIQCRGDETEQLI